MKVHVTTTGNNAHSHTIDRVRRIDITERFLIVYATSVNHDKTRHHYELGKLISFVEVGELENA